MYIVKSTYNIRYCSILSGIFEARLLPREKRFPVENLLTQKSLKKSEVTYVAHRLEFINGNL